MNGILPQSLSVKSSGNPLFLSLDHETEDNSIGHVHGDIDLLFRVHASVIDKAFYGLNVTHSYIGNNTGNGIFCKDVRERTAVSNVTIEANQGYAGLLIQDGAADIWVNETRIMDNWGDGMNVSYAGGAVMVNGTIITRNRWRGAAFHYNDSSPYLPLFMEIVFKGRPSNNIYYLPTIVSHNYWGGILVGNFCIPAERRIEPKILMNWLELAHNHYHPSLEVFSCQGPGVSRTIVDITGNRIEGNTGMGVRIAPAVNLHAMLSSNQFLANNDTALFVKNANHPWLAHLGANVTISKNSFKFNRGKYIISIGLNEDSSVQRLLFNQQNEVRSNSVSDPYPQLPARSTQHAAMVVTSSNVVIRRNCFKNPDSEFEIATELSEHAKVIDARENNWGTASAPDLLRRIFDQFNRYSLARIQIDPFASSCNQVTPHITHTQEHFRQFRDAAKPYVLGGTVYENDDLPRGRYTVVDDLHVVPGARLSIAPGSSLEFAPGIGMLVQGELLRSEESHRQEKIVFTSASYKMKEQWNMRLVDEDGNTDVTEGRLEIFVENEWGTVCNRSWTARYAQMACNQLGLVLDPEYFENWRIFPSKGDLHMRMDNIRCEEMETDLTRCRHDGVSHNVAVGCRPTEVVGIRCGLPRWAGVRYSLLASPVTVTNQRTMNHWIIEKAGLFDFRVPQFSAAIQIDWNYHTFHDIEIKDNYWNGVDVIYNDLIRKPAIRNSRVGSNRRNGIVVRSAGITVEKVLINNNGQAGVRYNPQVSAALQRDIVSWLDAKEQPELEANNVYIIPNRQRKRLKVFQSELNQRLFLMARATEDCPEVPLEPCSFEMFIDATGTSYGLAAKMAVQIVNPVSNVSDEDVLLFDQSGGKVFSARKDSIMFPFTSRDKTLRVRYTRSYGEPKLILLVMFLDSQEYVDRFIHFYKCVIEDNQYGISSRHYNNLSYVDGTLTNRWDNEKIWFQKVNFSRNSEAVLWVQSSQHTVLPKTPIAQITYDVDNCSIAHNTGAIVETHRDLYASANVFHWRFWSNTFANNSGSGIYVRLPDTYDLTAKQEHTFWMTENRFKGNEQFSCLLDGFYAFANISSNNFTENSARKGSGIFEIRGMEKKLVMERNRFLLNWGHWMVKLDITSQSLKYSNVPSHIQYNYFMHNHFIKPKADYVDMWPRSFAIGVFGSQRIDIHYNRIKNTLMDFELVSGCKYQTVEDTMNVTYNWWGMGNEAELSQRIFDFDDWNTFMLANFSPFYVSNEHFIDFWWDFRGRKGQLATATLSEPSVFDLKGRMFESKNLTLIRERWHQFPHYYKPFRPYQIIRDLTIMPGATLTIESGVEVHIWPNVRILVLGNLIADGSYWEPIRFKPINTTEFDQVRGRIGTRYKRSFLYFRNRMERSRKKRSDVNLRIRDWIRKKRARDIVYEEFPSLHREDPYYQRFGVSLTSNGSQPGRSGFLMVHNATTGEVFPSCDREFTIRNAQVVCRELGFHTMNIYHWITPQWNYNPQVRIIKTYMEPRQCRGDENSLDRCPLRLTGNDSQWMCMDNEHFNYIFCGDSSAVNSDYIGHWGGITFGKGGIELRTTDHIETSVLKNVEIVGGGSGHNDSWQSAGLQVFFRSPVIDHVNVTNSSMNAIQIFSPLEKVILNHLNVTDNKGKGVNIVTTNLQTLNGNLEDSKSPMNIPYATQGMLDMCAAGKEIELTGRIMVYYKYDPFPIDCVKVFTSKGRKVAWRFLQANLYSSKVELGRQDAMKIFSSETFMASTLLATFTRDGDTPFSAGVSSDLLAVHLRARGADPEYGFIAEISALPSPPDTNPVDEIVIRKSRINRNDRGAIDYQNSGEMSPNVVIEECSIAYNGIHLYGNVSTSNQAIQLNLHNTMSLLFRGNSITHNRGGLLVTARSSSAVARLTATIKSCLFSWNTNGTTIALLGSNYQMTTMINNIVSMNYALYYDTVILQDMSVNMTKNVFMKNTGLHTVHLNRNSRISSESHTLLKNDFVDNLALGHGHQYIEAFGYQPQRTDEFHTYNRPKRQVLNQQGVSFDWWTHVNNDTERYRSVIYAGGGSQVYRGNVFADPRTPYELATSRRTQFDLGTVDARENYWGYPGTVGVAAGKIVDQDDFPYLVKVDYQPVLESNTSLIEGDCPAGWFQAGNEEFKSCFLYVGAAATHGSAVEYCEELDAFLPYLRSDDVRQKEIARRIDQKSVEFVTEPERYSSFGSVPDQHLWVASAHIPTTQCGWLSARTAKIGYVNCNALLPFVCERGGAAYTEPWLWRRGFVLALILLCVLLVFLFILALCWCIKSRRRKEETLVRKGMIRASLKLQQKSQADRGWNVGGRTHTSAHGSVHSGTVLNAYGDPFIAHKNMLRGNNSRSPTETVKTSCSDAFSVSETETGTKTTSYLTRTGTKTTDDSVSTYSTGYYGVTKRGVTASPNSYAEIPTLNTFQSPNRKTTRPQHLKNGGPRYSMDSRNDSSMSSSTPYSTCESELDSTLTADTWSESASTASETTITNKRLLPHRDGISSHTMDARRMSAHSLGVPRAVPTPAVPPNPQPSRPAPPPPHMYGQGLRYGSANRSLVDLQNPHDAAMRRNSEVRPHIIETSM